MPWLLVSYDCSECGEEAESDDEGGFICRRCSLYFPDFTDGTEGVSMTPADFVDTYGNQPPAPSHAERIAALMAKYGGD